MKSPFKTLIFAAAVAIGGFATLAMPQSASAMTLQLGPLIAVPENIQTALPVEKAGHRRVRNRRVHRRAHRRTHRRAHRYNRHLHGQRFRSRRGRHRHRHNGYWYAVPFWLGIAAATAPYRYSNSDAYYDGEGSGHVAWCLRRYRSYNPRTDTFRGYDGYDHRCISPYS